MRKEIFRMPRAEAIALFARAPSVHVATTSENGEPILRTLNTAVWDDRLVFHGAAAGEKLGALGREAVIAAEEIVADIPSYFVDAERACPATTLYRSAQLHGRLEPIESADDKAAAMTALMAKHQPEGGFVPMAADHPLYEKALKSLLVFGVSLERLDGKAKLAQNRTPEEQRRIVTRLWERGAPGDPAAIDAILRANPKTPRPDFLRGPHNTTLECAPTDVRAVRELLVDTYWNDRFSADEIERAHPASDAWIVARDPLGTMIASARAISDRVKYAWIYDVVVAPVWRGKNIGDAIMRLLLDHPAVRHTRFVRLGTRDAMAFYAKMGFIETRTITRPYVTTEMVMAR